MDIMEKLVENVVARRYEDLPRQAIEATRSGVLETLGTLIAGASAPGCQIVVDLVREWGGKQESTILIHGGKVPAQNAALVSSTMARALEFDGGMERGLHPCASSVPSALAVAEMCGGINGKEFLTAIAVGEDLAGRINLATTYRPEGKISRTTTCMPFGVAAIAGRLLRLDKNAMWNAMGIAFTQAAGSMQSIVDGALAERVSQGFASSSGIISAILAKRGITGAKNILQGTHGFFSLFSRDQGDAGALVAGLGQDFFGTQIFRKRYPQCGAAASATDGVLELRRKHNIQPTDVDGIRVILRQTFLNTVRPSFRIRDTIQVDAQFSLPYIVANALARGYPKLEHFTADSVQNEEVLAISKKVQCIAGDEEIDKQSGLAQSAIVEIRTKNGGCYTKFVKSPVGWLPGRPLTYEEIVKKFRDCVAYAPIALPEGNTDRLINMVTDLEGIRDVSCFSAFLKPKSFPYHIHIMRPLMRPFRNW
jgi:2-methylcitrate dehydratase PrpD